MPTTLAPDDLQVRPSSRNNRGDRPALLALDTDRAARITLPENTPVNPTVMLDQMVLLSFSLRGFTNTRKVPRNQIRSNKDAIDLTETQAEQTTVIVKADRKMMSASKQRLVSRELDAINQLDSGMRQWLYERTVTKGLFKSGMYPLAVAVIERVEERLAEYLTERALRIEAFCAVYFQRVSEAEVLLAESFNPLDYPPNPAALRRLFSVSWMWTALAPSEKLQRISPELFAREQRKFSETMADAAELGRKLIRAEFVELVGNMRKKLSGDKTISGRKQTIRGTFLPSIQSWLEAFQDRNLTDDRPLSALVAEARRVLSGVDDELLRTDEACQEQIRAGFQQIGDTLTSFLIDAPSRDIQLADDDEDDKETV